MVEVSGQTTVSAAGEVPHPLHVYVTGLLKRVRATQMRLNNKQVRPAQAVSAGTAWISTTATKWAGEFGPRTVTYGSASRGLDDALVDLLRSTPATCTAEEAARWRAKLGGGHGA